MEYLKIPVGLTYIIDKVEIEPNLDLVNNNTMIRYIICNIFTIPGSSHESLAKYLDDVRTNTDPAFYDELKDNVENVPAILKSMKML